VTVASAMLDPMERMTGRMRRIPMMDLRLLRGPAGLLGLLGAGLLFAAVSGCGSVVASDSATDPAAGATTTAGASTPAGAATTAAPQVGCASVNQATAVSIRHLLHYMTPVGSNPLATSTYRDPDKVQALFGQLCAAVTHPAKVQLMHCPADVGTEFLGTFYDGKRVLATFTYFSSGCERVSVTAAGKTLSTMVYGRAAAAAPHLATDLAAVLGGPKPGQMRPQGGINPGGPNVPA
jgi:hypothetical protein